MEFIISGLVFGLVTSLHCAGMCGPIAIALPLHGETKAAKLFGGILYNIGRTTTYLILGAAFGVIGQGISTLGFQKWLSIITGILMILTGLFPSLFRFDVGASAKSIPGLNYIKRSLRTLFSTKSYGSLYTIGFLNGFLPCGPLYSAIIISLATGSLMSSLTFMLMFGLGTIPMLLAISLAGNFLGHGLRKKLSNLLPALIIFMGVLFVLRGLNLGIPFLSPSEDRLKEKIEQTKNAHPVNSEEAYQIDEIIEKGKEAECCKKKGTTHDE